MVTQSDMVSAALGGKTPSTDKGCHSTSNSPQALQWTTDYSGLLYDTKDTCIHQALLDLYMHHAFACTYGSDCTASAHGLWTCPASYMWL